MTTMYLVWRPRGGKPEFLALYASKRAAVAAVKPIEREGWTVTPVVQQSMEGKR